MSVVAHVGGWDGALVFGLPVVVTWTLQLLRRRALRRQAKNDEAAGPDA